MVVLKQGVSMIEAMLVDDEPLAVKMLLKLVDWKRFDINICATAADGEGAFEAFLRHKPDLILTDIGMPGMNGLDFIRKVREVNQSTEFILISAHADFKYIQLAMRLGCADYVLKPIDEAELEKIIEKTSERIHTRIRVQSSFAARSEREETQKKKRALMEYMKTGRENEALSLLGHDMARADIRLLSIDLACKEDRQNGQSRRRIIDQINYVERMLENIFMEFGEYLLFDNEEVSWIALVWESDKERMSSRAEHVAAFFRSDLDCSPIICFTCAGDGLSSLPSLYEKLCQLRRYSLFLEAGDVLGGEKHGESELENPDRDADRLTALEAKMSLAIRGADKRSALGVLDEVMELSRFIDPSLLDKVYGFCYNALLLVRERKIADDGGKELPSALRGDYARIASLKTQAELRELTVKAISLMQVKTAGTAQGGDASIVSSHQSGMVQRAVEILNERYASSITLEDLCGELAVSKNYFCYLFKKETGKRVWEYLTDIRMEEAGKLLRETYLMSFEVAYRVGYENPSYFAKIFKRHFKMTPNEYRSSP